jgi:hypothetical protein
MIRKTLIVAALVCRLSPAFAADNISAFVPNFAGPEGLSKGVTTVLQLQLWSTLRASDNQSRGDFGSGGITPDDLGRKPASFEEAEGLANGPDTGSQFVLFGSVRPYGEGAMFRSYLAIPNYQDLRDEKKERWNLIFRVTSESVLSVEADIPQRRYVFGLGIISDELLREYGSLTAIPLYARPGGGKVVGALGKRFTALEAGENAVRVQSGNQTGWVRTPRLLTKPSEAVDFLIGLIRIFRGDWEGAQPFLVRIYQNTYSTNDIRVDALLYLALCLEKQGRSGRRFIDEAGTLNPYAQRVAVYSIMSDIAELKRLVDRRAAQQEIRSKAETLLARLAKYDGGLIADGGFIERARAIVAAIGRVWP